jgi:hypothetical protein
MWPFHEPAKFTSALDSSPDTHSAGLPHSGGGSDRAGFLLVIYMRLLAGVWVIQGLLQWSAILLPPEPLFYNVTALHGAAVVFFSIFDLVAAVGLWLVTSWGGAIWLFNVIAQIFIAIALPGFFSPAWVGVDVALIAIYFVVTWRASHAGAPRFRLNRR